MRNRKIKTISNRKCFVETNPIESQWICRNKEFPAPVEIKPTENPKEIIKIWNFLHLQSFVETDPIESQWICRNKESPTPASCLKTYPGYLG